MLEQSLSAEALLSLNQQLLLLKVFVFSVSLTPVLPGSKLEHRGLSSLDVAGMLQGQEDSLFEPSGGHDVAQTVVSVKKRLLFAVSEPHDEAALKSIPFISLTDHVKEGLLGLSEQDSVSPLANVLAERAFADLSGEAGNNFGSFHGASESILSHEEGSSPVVEELAAAGFSDVRIDDVRPLAVLVHGVKGVSVPDSDEMPRPVIVVIVNNFDKLGKSVLEFPGYLGSSKYFLEGVFTLETDVFIKDLDHKFGHQHADSELVATSKVIAFYVHSVDIRVVLLLELADSSNKIVALAREVSHLLLKVELLLSSVDFLTSEDF